jgi:hypothetical protein
MTCKSIMIHGKDHHNENYRKIIKVSRLSKREIEDLTLTKCHDQGLHNFVILEEVLIGI